LPQAARSQFEIVGKHSLFPCVIDTILIGSDFDQPAHEIANTAKDTRRDVVCVDGFLVLALNTAMGGCCPLAQVLRHSYEGAKMRMLLSSSITAVMRKNCRDNLAKTVAWTRVSVCEPAQKRRTFPLTSIGATRTAAKWQAIQDCQ
jgi:hypothetical protein